MLVWKAIIWVPLQSVNMKLIIIFDKYDNFSQIWALIPPILQIDTLTIH